MDRCDFSSIITYLKDQISESNQMSQPEFLYEIFEDFLDSPENNEFTLDNGLIYTLFIQDSSISEAKKAELAPLYQSVNSRILFLAKLISFGMERQFVKRDAKNKKLIAGGSLSPMVLDYIMDGETPRPCRHFVGREEEIIELHKSTALASVPASNILLMKQVYHNDSYLTTELCQKSTS